MFVAALTQLPTLSVLGASTIEYSSNSEFFDGEQLVINFASDQSTEELNVQYTADELSSETGEPVQNSVEIEVVEQSTSAVYDLRPNNRMEIKTVDAVQHSLDSDKTELEASNWGRDNCTDLDDDGDLSRGSDYLLKEKFERSIVEVNYWEVNCFNTLEQLGNTASIDSSRTEFQTTFRVDVEGEDPETVTLSNSDVGQGQTARLGNVVIDWTGNLDTGANTYEVTDEIALHGNYLQDNWRLIQDGRYSTYENYVMNDVIGYNGLLDDMRNGEISPEEAEIEWNRRASQADDIYIASSLSEGSFSGSLSNGQLTVPYENDIIWPSFSIYIKGGDYLEVEKPVGEPSIVGTPGAPFEIEEFGGGDIKVDIRNSGGSDGSFTVRAKDCSTGFDFSQTSETILVGSGVTKTVDLHGSFSSTSTSSAEISGSCTVEVSNQDRTSVSQVVDLTGVQEEECSPGELFKGSEDGQVVVRECSSDGVGSEVVDTCESDETVDTVNGQLQCVDPSDPGEGEGGGGSSGESCMITLYENPVGDDIELRNPFCLLYQSFTGFFDFSSVGSWFNSILGIFDIIVSSIAGILVYGNSKSFLSNTGRIENEQVVLFFSILFAALTWYAVFNLVTAWFVKVLIVAAISAYIYFYGSVAAVIQGAKALI